MVSLVDAIVIILLIFGAVVGFKKGLIKSAVSFFGTVLVIILAYKLKNPLSEYLYLHLPFFNFEGPLAGVTVLNIIIYEGIAFLIIFSILEILLKVVIFASGIIEKLLNFTIILGLISKILGLIFGFIEYYLIIFVILFMINNFTVADEYIKEDSLSYKILNNTPVLKETIEDQTKAISEITELKDIYSNDKNGYNKNAFDVLLKYDILSTDSAKKLIEEKKLDFDGAEEIIKKYEK